MKKLFSFPKKKKHSSSTPDSGSVLSASYELKEKDLGKVHKAALAGDLAKLKQLAKKNDVNQLDKENRSALHIACACGHVEVVQFLVDSKAKLNLCDNQNRSALMKAVQVQNERCVSILLENHADPKLVDINGNTALHLAANIPSISTAVLLLEYDADINASNKECFTPLTVAVRENHYEMAEFLLKEGADVNFIDQEQRSLLMIAAGSGQINMLRLLLQFDADSTLKDSKGWSADNYADMNGHHACSVLIIDHGRQRTDVPSLLHQGPSSNIKKNVLSGPSCHVEAGFSLGGPATDKPGNGASEAGKDLEDSSQSESLSRVSKSLGDDWSSSEEDDESVLNQKKLPKLNLREMIAFKKRGASRKPDKSLSDTESDIESENRVQRNPSFLKPVASNTNNALQGSVDPSPSSFLKQHQTTSSPLPVDRKKNPTEDRDESDKEEAGDKVETEILDENRQTEEEGDSPDANSAIAEKEIPKNMERDFLSELGLEKGEEEQDSWDSESPSENSSNVHGRNQSIHAESQEKMSSVEDVVKEDLFYVPSFIRGDGGNRMAVLELRRSVGRTRGSQGVVANKASGEHVDEDDTVYTEMKKPKWDPLSVLNKCDGDTDRKIDVMEELVLCDADNHEEPSDWDSASTASKKSLPDCRMASPEFEEFPQCPSPFVEKQKQDISATAPLPSQRTINSEKILPSASHLKPHPQPYARKLVLQKSEGEEESDLEPDSLTSAFGAAKTDSQLQTVADPPAVVKPGSPVVSAVAKEDKSDVGSVEQHPETGGETTKTAVELQKSVDSSSTVDKESEGVAMEKPETKLGWQKEQSAHSNTTVMEERPAAIHSVIQRDKSTDGVPIQLPLPLKQTCKSMRKEGQGIAIEDTLQLQLGRGTQGSRASKANAHVNGTSLSVFDDSTLSDMSDDEGRLPCGDQQKNENPGEMEMTEDLDELTQSSDTATDDMDSPTSGYRHASLLIQNLDSATLDSRTMVKLQNIFHEYERSIQKARSRHGYLTDKVSQLELERAEMKGSLEEVKDLKSALERTQLELHTEITNFKFQLKQEQENRRNATMMYNTTKDKLRRAEEQQQLEFQERQKVELTFRNLELEMRTLVNNMKQLEEDHSETQRLLAQERSARTLQENLLNNHLRKQQEIEVENKRNLSKSHEALSQLTEASDREKELLQQNATLQEQLSILKLDLERSQANSDLKESHLVEENEALKEQLEDVRRDLKLNDRAHAETIFNCNNQLTTFKSELAKATAGLENEKQTRETLDSEVQSSRSRLAVALQEVERHLAAQADTEKRLLREKDEHQRLKDRFTAEAASQREAVNSLSQKLTKAEAHANSMENEVHRVTLQLTEKGLLLEVLQREKEQAAARAKELEAALQAERELVRRSGARQEAAQERLAQAQSETMLLRQQLQETQNKGVAKERAVTDAQERFSDILSKLRSDCEERVQLVQETSKELASKAADLREQVYKLEEEKNERETSLRQMQQELADSLKKLSMSEASLEVNTHYRNDLEEEKVRLFKDLERLRRKLEESEDQYVEAERRIKALKSAVDEKENQLTTNAQKLQEALSAAAISNVTSKQLEEAVQRLEIENARLEAAAKQQSNQIDALQKAGQESAAARNHLEGLVTSLQSSKMSLEDQLSQEVQKQGMFNTTQDSKALWEEELKCRSKLGLRMAELEKEKGELSNQMEVEKKKVKKIAEQKKAVDTRLDQEMKRNTELQKEMYRLRTLLKTAKKKLRDPDTGGGELGSAMSREKMEFNRYNHDDGAFGRMREKVGDIQVQLEKEASRCSHLEKVNEELQDELASLKSLKHSNDQLEKSKRKLEEEVLDLRRHVEAAQMEQRQAEQYCLDVKERARQEIQQKLEQVNLFLQSQAASQEALDQIKAANEATLRSQLEQKLRELDGELGRARTTHQEILNQKDSTRTELEQYRQLYAEEVRLRKSMATKLERANARLADANSKLLDERSKSVIANSSLRGSLLDGGSFSSIANSGAILGHPNRSIGLSLLSPVSAGQSSRVEDYLAEMQKELDRNVSKELNRATAELDAGSTRLSPVGSASRTELDPISRATQQYLEVLKKNKMI